MSEPHPLAMEMSGECSIFELEGGFLRYRATVQLTPV